MNAPRPSQSAEAARAAALQAEFNEKRWVWVPDEKEGYLAGWVNHEDEDAAEVVMSTVGEVHLWSLLLSTAYRGGFLRYDAFLCMLCRR